MRLPVGFVSHGAPPLALDAARGGDLRRWGEALPRPAALLVVSAHWEATPPALGATETRALIHDYSGFDPRLSDVRYPAPGAPQLAERVTALLEAGDVPVRATDRGQDHGVWVPLVHLFPDADVPLLQLSLPSRLEPRALLAIGERLRPLREEGVLLLASGGLVHDLRRIDWSERSAPPVWATAFEAWARRALVEHDRDALADWRRAAPDSHGAHPTAEHFLPLLVAAGAAEPDEPVTFPVSGFEYGSLSRTSAQLGK